jgi:hypothetical protein
MEGCAMKDHLVLFCICIFFGFAVSANAEEMTFSGQFTQGTAFSQYHYFTLSKDSSVQVKMNSSCNVNHILLGIDDDNSGFFDSTVVQTNPENSTLYGVFPLAGGPVSDGNYRYRVWLECPDHNEESYDLTVVYNEYLMYSPLDEDKDQEPNNNQSTAVYVGETETASNKWIIAGHLGFLFDTHEVYNNSTRDGLDYFNFHLPVGIYTLHAQRVGDTLVKHAPDVPLMRISNAENSETLLSGALTEGASYEFKIQQGGAYSLGIASNAVVSSYSDMPYGGYWLDITSNKCDVNLENMRVEDNVCGNKEVISATLKNNCLDSKWYSALSILTTVTGPAYNYEKKYYQYDFSILPGKGITLVGADWTIPEDVYSGQYTSCIEVRKNLDGLETGWTTIDKICTQNGVMCNKNVGQAGMLFLLLKKWSWDNN